MPVLERVEGVEPESMLRYVTEGVVERNESISLAVKTGIVDQAAYPREVYDRIGREAQAMLSPAAAAAFATFPGLRAFARHLEVLPVLLDLLGEPPPSLADGFYHLRVDGRVVALDSLDAVRNYFLPAARSFA